MTCLSKGTDCLGGCRRRGVRGGPSAEPAYRRAPVRLSTGAGTRPRATGKLCAQDMLRLRFQKTWRVAVGRFSKVTAFIARDLYQQPL